MTGVLSPRLVKATGCRVLMAVAERLPGGRLPVVHVLPADDAVHSEDLDVALAGVNRGVENCIAIDPAQYLWSYRRFRRSPKESPRFMVNESTAQRSWPLFKAVIPDFAQQMFWNPLPVRYLDCRRPRYARLWNDEAIWAPRCRLNVVRVLTGLQLAFHFVYCFAALAG